MTKMFLYTPQQVFISVLLVFILNFSTLSRVSFLLLFIIICSYFISGFGMYIQIFFYTLTLIQVYIHSYLGCHPNVQKFIYNCIFL